MTSLLLPPSRLTRWLDNFATRHGETEVSVEGGALVARAQDGSRADVHLPWGRGYDGPAEVEPFVAATAPPADWGVLLVHKGGYAIARMHGAEWHASKTGQRHVQGRTKAGGQSQQRFARRRDNQAKAAYAAAADHAARLLLSPTCPVVVLGGDHKAVDEVLADPRLKALVGNVVPPWLAVPDPRRGVLEQAVTDAAALRLTVENAHP